jgi:hypothetical protein
LCTLYMHHGMCHILDMIRHVPLNISDMSQQWFEALLTDGKLFSNKRLQDEKQDKGRNYQILGKERERIRMKRDVHMPLTRNEKRHLTGYEGQKRTTAQTVDRAVRRGQLQTSRGKLQMDKRIAKREPALAGIVERIRNVRQITADTNRAAAREWGAAGSGAHVPLSTAANSPSDSSNGLPMAAASLEGGGGGGAEAVRGGGENAAQPELGGALPEGAGGAAGPAVAGWELRWVVLGFDKPLQQQGVETGGPGEEPGEGVVVHQQLAGVEGQR